MQTFPFSLPCDVDATVFYIVTIVCTMVLLGL